MLESRLAPIVLAAAAIAAAGCKGSTTTKDTPATLAKLGDCQDKLAKLAEKDKLIQDYEAEIARLKLEGGSNQEYHFVIEGDVLTLKSKPTGGGGGPPVDDKVANELSKQFFDVIGKSRGPIQKCYEQALKKNQGLQARTITLTVSASFAPSGQHSRSSFSPDLGEAFNGCMKNVASHWKIATAPQSMTFQATVSLSPT